MRYLSEQVVTADNFTHACNLAYVYVVMCVDCVVDQCGIQGCRFYFHLGPQMLFRSNVRASICRKQFFGG